MPAELSEFDLAQLHERGLSVEEASDQLRRLRAPARYVDLDRPCTPGDGIETVADDEIDDLLDAGEQAARQGRCLKFVPASGAATRMMQALLHYHGGAALPSPEAIDAEIAAGRGEAAELRTFIEGVDRFAFADDLRAALEARGHELDTLVRSGTWAPILDTLLSDSGLDYAALPKGLLKFHAYADGARTPFEEHLVEAANVVARADGRCRLHFTVSDEHRSRFTSLLDTRRSYFEPLVNVTLDVGFSTQKPSTDTLAIDAEGRPFRLEGGRLLWRPSGHGALLENLADLHADLVWIKNIDNVVPDRLKEATYRWARVLTGYLIKRRREAPTDRPTRVCGMVRNMGEPGGGPFWVRDADGAASRQIVEMAQIDPGSAARQDVVGSSTHFNPVFMVCALRDRRGHPYDLRRFVDPDAAIVARKSYAGRELTSLERPGLWNGSMAGWDTWFVEVPELVFNPVKTLNVLLRDEHQP